MVKRIVCLVIGLTIVFSFVCAAEEEEVEIKKVERKVVMGELISRVPIKNPRQIGIACKNSKYDAYFSVGEEIEIVRKKSLDEIRLGDMITVTYDEVTEVREVMGEEREKVKRIAKVIRFVSPTTRKIRREPGEVAGSDESSVFDLLRSMEE